MSVNSYIKESRLTKKVKGYSCCSYHLLPGGAVKFHEWDEVFGAEITTLWLKGFVCEFCGQVYYLAI